MCIIYRILLLIVCFGILIDCQGASGRKGSNSDRADVYGSNKNTTKKKFVNGTNYEGQDTFCTSTFCKTAVAIIVAIAIVLIGIVLVIKGCCTSSTSSTSTTAVPVPENATLIKLDKQNTDKQNTDKQNTHKDNTDKENIHKLNIHKQNVNDDTLFRSGIWLARYLQYEEWHGPHQFSLVFDHQSMKVKGSGSDDVGIFKIDGIFSNKTNEIGLNKRYQPNTGDPSENFEHAVSIELTWNPGSQQFEGKWYVDTDEYHGQNSFELVFDGLP